MLPRAGHNPFPGPPAAQPAIPPAPVERHSTRQRRARRLLLLLAGIWLINLFDLGFTLVALEQNLMTELNPLASRVIPWGTTAVISYKLLLLGLGSAILWWQRERILTELALWAYALVCVALAVHWQNVYHSAEPRWVEASTIQEILPASTSQIYIPLPQLPGPSDRRPEAQGANRTPADGPFEDLEGPRQSRSAEQHPLPPDQRPCENHPDHARRDE